MLVRNADVQPSESSREKRANGVVLHRSSLNFSVRSLCMLLLCFGIAGFSTVAATHSSPIRRPLRSLPRSLASECLRAAGFPCTHADGALVMNLRGGAAKEEANANDAPAKTAAPRAKAKTKRAASTEEESSPSEQPAKIKRTKQASAKPVVPESEEPPPEKPTKPKATKAAKEKPAAKQPKSKDSKQADDEYADIKTPKRAMSAYMLYANHIRHEVVKENPELKMTEISRVIGAKWKKVGAEEKAKFEKLAEEAKQDYDRQKAEYESKVPEEVRKGRTQKKRLDKKGDKKAPKKDPNAPKRPVNAFTLYANKARAALTDELKDLTLGEVTKKLAEKWNGLPKEEKLVYEAQAAKLREKYVADKAIYEAKKTASSEAAEAADA